MIGKRGKRRSRGGEMTSLEDICRSRYRVKNEGI
jgi:hypothetical protein